MSCRYRAVESSKLSERSINHDEAKSCRIGVSAFCFGGAAQAQPVPGPTIADMPVGKQAGTIMVRLRAIGVIPETLSSSASVIGGNVHMINTPAPETDLSYFLTNNIAAEIIAAITRHNVSAGHSVPGHVDVGSVWVLPPTVMLRYHFIPHDRFSPYVGAGLTVAFFYDGRPSGPTATKVGFRNNVGGGPGRLRLQHQRALVRQLRRQADCPEYRSTDQRGCDCRKDGARPDHYWRRDWLSFLNGHPIYARPPVTGRAAALRYGRADGGPGGQ